MSFDGDAAVVAILASCSETGSRTVVPSGAVKESAVDERAADGSTIGGVTVVEPPVVCFLGLELVVELGYI